MASTVAIFHGYGGNKPNSWLSWLNLKLTKRGFNTIYPTFPFMGAATIESWDREFSKHIEEFVEPVSIVGHSGGVIFSFYVAEKYNITIEKMVLVCPLSNKNGVDSSSLVDKVGIEDQIPYLKAFVHQGFDFEIIKSRVKEFVFILSDNDHNVPYQETLDYYKGIFPMAKFVTLHNYGHVNEKAGIKELPQVFSELV